MFMNRWLDVSRADEPDEIKWENNGYSQKNRVFRRFLIWIIAIALIFIGATAMVYISETTKSLQEEYGTDEPCDIEITKSNEAELALEAYIDFTEKNKEQGLMRCFCEYLIDQSYADAALYSFKKANPADDRKYCQSYAITKVREKILVYGSSLMIVFINTLICYVFEMISGWEKHHSENGQTMYQFKKIVIMQYVNIALIILLVNFKVQKQNTDDGGRGLWLLGFLPILRGQYSDFDARWYANVGTVLCITLTINILSPHGSLLFQPLRNLLERCWDRDCSCTVKKKARKGSKSDDDVNTKKELQSEVQNLYTGS